VGRYSHEMRSTYEPDGDTRALDLGELRAPVQSMLAYLDLVLEEDLTEQESRRFLEVIRSTAARLQQLVAAAERRGSPAADSAAERGAGR
jgi:BMFP domain-containing protein YqiC